MVDHSSLITLDRDDEPWVGRWIGVGQVRVWSDGTYEVIADPRSSEGLEEADRSLRFGWAEPLSQARRGLHATTGVTLVDSRTHSGGMRVDGALLVGGESWTVDPVVQGLLVRGWKVLADRPAPIEFGHDEVRAHSSVRPVVLRRSRRNDFEALREPDLHPTRVDSDAEFLDVVTMCDGPGNSGTGSHMSGNQKSRGEVSRSGASGPECSTPLRAIVMTDRRSPHGSVVTPVRGHEAVELASRILIGGVLGSDHDDPTTALKRLLALTRCRMAVLPAKRGTDDNGLSELEHWWEQA